MGSWLHAIAKATGTAKLIDNSPTAQSIVKAGETVRDTDLFDVVDVVSDAGSKAADTAKDAAEKAWDAAANTADTIVDTVSNLPKVVTDVFKNGVSAATGLATDAVGSLKKYGPYAIAGIAALAVLKFSKR